MIQGTEIQREMPYDGLLDFPLLGSCLPITEDEQIQTDNGDSLLNLLH